MGFVQPTKDAISRIYERVFDTLLDVDRVLCKRIYGSFVREIERYRFAFRESRARQFQCQNGDLQFPKFSYLDMNLDSRKHPYFGPCRRG